MKVLITSPNSLFLSVLTLAIACPSGLKDTQRTKGKRWQSICSIEVVQSSLSTKFLVFSAELLERVFKDLLPQLQLHWQQWFRRSHN